MTYRNYLKEIETLKSQDSKWEYAGLVLQKNLDSSTRTQVENFILKLAENEKESYLARIIEYSGSRKSKHRLLRLYTSLGEVENAKELSRKLFPKINEEKILFARKLEKIDELEKAALEYQRAGDLKKAANIYRKLDCKTEALALYLRIGNHLTASKILCSLGKYSEAARLLIKNKEIEIARKLIKEKNLDDIILAESWLCENGLVAKSIYQRKNKLQAKNLEERIGARLLGSGPCEIDLFKSNLNKFDNGISCSLYISEIDNCDFLELCLSKNLKKETKDTIRKVLGKFYLDSAAGLEFYDSHCCDYPSASDSMKAEEYRKKARKLLIRTNRHDRSYLLESDPIKKIEYLTSTKKFREARNLLESLEEKHTERGEVK